MRIGIFGAGAMAGALGTRWTAAGHELMITGRTAAKARALADGWGARTGGFGEVAEFADVALIAVLHQGMAATLDRIGDALRGKVIIDCNNPVEVEHFTLVTPPGRSMAQEIERATGGHVVKAFNLCHARVWRLDPPVFDGRRLTVPYCGDDPAALDVARRLITDLGCEPLPVGGLRHAHHLEATAAIVISLLFGGHDPHTVFNLVDRTTVTTSAQPTSPDRRP
ncbi:NADP oxidoreductase coenzyme F420-dependent protein [Planomonospora sphaerica]|uniref:NADP oxidoreductase coenzyme F420-dependent protein n=1 Tax=Planomonospora sphaerica TaxID=161355 RepID=A0A171CVZ7_9ACTN|nr:NAD(P)-binding domain-containing protein [Planomonospora sphaerica]GAT67301.1 NADP oxidoreductase coenzyme F420-dependent protein [Planomonospora sphaerica]